jgi:asparagine synthase (glutamine-hydrolysing)
MCGLAGIVGPGAEAPASLATLRAMLEVLAHRGPDDDALVSGEDHALGARRLSMLDLEDGRQPMRSEGGDVVVALNGEIYNDDELRAGLRARGARFRTRSDTEVALRLYEERGAELLEDLEGMFALAIWDARRRTLLLARDRLGEKPLVWFEAGGRLVFASEWRALARHPDVPREPDADATALYLLHRFVPAPRTGVRDVFRLPPGQVLTWRDGTARVRPYWSLPVPGDEPPPRDRRAAAAEVRELLERSVTSRLRGDVPVGVFLSGGLDSAGVAALAARRGPLVTFTLRPTDPDFDEGEGARATAEALGAEHHEVPVDAEGIDAGFEEVFARVDEPVGDSSLVPTLLLARGARPHVKAVLGGEGADEVFGGYPTYLGARAARLVKVLPRFARRALARHLGRSGRNVGTGWLIRRLLEGADLPLLERHLLWFGAYPAAEQALLWRPESRPPILDGDLLEVARAAAAPALASGDPIDPLLRVDLLLHLPEALLAKVDRATMLASLEARAPFLERRLVERGAILPGRWKVSGLRTKIVLREALRDVVPPEVLRRKKRGFAVPVSRALAGSLGELLRGRLHDSQRVRDFLDPAPFLTQLEEHRAGRADHGRRLYTLLAWIEWVERWLPVPVPAPNPS